MSRLLLIVLFCLPQIILAQDKYWVTFMDKNTQGYSYEQNLSKETIRNRNRYGLPLLQYTDIPVDPSYVESLSRLGLKVLVQSKWLNSVSVVLSPDQVKQVKQLPFIFSVDKIDARIVLTKINTDIEAKLYAPAIQQMQGEEFFNRGITGKGVTIGLIDAGFYSAYNDQYLQHIFNDKRIVQQRDFLNPPVSDLARDTVGDSDYHGKIVLQHIAGYDSLANLLIGLAPNSRYYLARTENDAMEYRGEEDDWIRAMEWMDSLGVRLINTSLGYSIKMDDPNDNYKQEEMNGKTARISKAAQIATDEKGIFLVVSAGNEGDNPKWRIISAPADAEGALSVGATLDYSWEKVGYSSIGPEFLPYLKPNVSCYSLNGTSFSAPSVAGFVACLMELDSTLNNKQLKMIVEKSGHLYPYGNNYIGYGVPLASKAIKLIEGKDFANVITEEKVKTKKFSFKPESEVSEALIFHKKSKTVVLKQETISLKNDKFSIKRLSGETETTIVIGKKVIEVKWD